MCVHAYPHIEIREQAEVKVFFDTRFLRQCYEAGWPANFSSVSGVPGLQEHAYHISPLYGFWGTRIQVFMLAHVFYTLKHSQPTFIYFLWRVFFFLYVPEPIIQVKSTGPAFLMCPAPAVAYLTLLAKSIFCTRHGGLE